MNLLHIDCRLTEEEAQAAVQALDPLSTLASAISSAHRKAKIDAAWMAPAVVDIADKLKLREEARWQLVAAVVNATLDGR